MQHAHRIRRFRAAVAIASLSLMVACGDDNDDATAVAGASAVTTATAPATPVTPAGAPRATTAAPNGDMQAVLDALTALGVRPISSLTTEAARTQPTPADAVRTVLAARGQSTAPESVREVRDITYPGPGGPLPARVYRPTAAVALGSQAPGILYIHGGGWVLATIDTYDASARALANATGAVVVSVEYRKAPEAPWPAAHEDTWAAWQWLQANAASLDIRPGRIAVAGESAGADMAAAIALRARDAGVLAPRHQLLVYPVADAVVSSLSESENQAAAPLRTADLPWFVERYLPNASDRPNPLFTLLNADVRNVAPATVVLAQIDPLRTEGEAYAARLQAAGVPVELRTYAGVTHEFFGMGAVVPEAREAVRDAARRLIAAFVGL